MLWAGFYLKAPVVNLIAALLEITSGTTDRHLDTPSVRSQAPELGDGVLPQLVQLLLMILAGRAAHG